MLPEPPSRPLMVLLAADRTGQDSSAGEAVQLTQSPLSSHYPGKHISVWREARDQGLVTSNILSQLDSVPSPFTLSGKKLIAEKLCYFAVGSASSSAHQCPSGNKGSFQKCFCLWEAYRIFFPVIYLIVLPLKLSGTVSAQKWAGLHLLRWSIPCMQTVRE